MTPLATIAEQLRTCIGLDPATLGSRALAHAVRGRLRARGLSLAASAAVYLKILAADPAEWEALVETVVVPETWFFRDREPFVLLAHWAAAHCVAASRPAPVRVLSLPCSTGEEVWSIAIALAAAGVAPEAFRVDGLDLSQRALTIARAGVYPTRSLRRHRLDPAWSNYLLARPDGGFEIAAELRPAVQFSSGNLMRAREELAGRRFDCIFSRNLLIYCDDATRAGAVETFAAALRPNGLLFLGHAETLPSGTDGFVREGPPAAFAWRRCNAATRRPAASTQARRRRGEKPAATDAVKPVIIDAVSREARARKDRGVPSKADASASRRRAERPDGLDAVKSSTSDDASAARALADRGRLDEAAGLASARLEQAPDDAGAHALLGVVRAAQGRDAEAAEHLRRALYLEPACEEALVHLPLVLERLGQNGTAARLRQRARRLEGTR